MWKFFESTRKWLSCTQIHIASVDLAPLNNICSTCSSIVTGDVQTRIKMHRPFQTHPAWFADFSEEAGHVNGSFIDAIERRILFSSRLCSFPFFLSPLFSSSSSNAGGSFIILPLPGITRASRVEANLCDTWHTATSDNEPPGTRLTSISHFVRCILTLVT